MLPATICTTTYIPMYKHYLYYNIYSYVTYGYVYTTTYIPIEPITHATTTYNAMCDGARG